jgi:hypothetical protein
MRWDGGEWTVETAPSVRDEAILWDVTTFGANDIMGVGASVRVRHGNAQPSRTFVARGAGG